MPEGDAWFPEFNWGDWEEVWREDHPSDERHAFPYSFIRLDRK
jgi:dihydrofolate reductase